MSLEPSVDLTDEKWNLVSQFFEFKNDAFSEEAEWRIYTVASLSSGNILDYRVAGKMLSPYQKFPIALDTITHVTLGPNNSTPKPVAEAALRRHGCEAGVFKSTASYKER